MRRFGSVLISLTLLLAVRPAQAAEEAPEAELRSRAGVPTDYVPPPLALGCAATYTRRDVPIQWFDTTGAYGWDIGDDEVKAFPMPFPVDFYGLRSQTVSVSANGWLSLVENSPSSCSSVQCICCIHQPIPSANPPRGVIAPFWRDLDPEERGTVPDQRYLRLKTFGYAPNRTYVLTWERFPAWGDALSEYTFQVAFYEATNVIRFQYLTMIGDQSAMTIGMENPGGTSGIQFAYNQNKSMEGKAMEFVPSFPSLTGCTGAAPLTCGAALVAQAMGTADNQRMYGCSTTGTYLAREKVFVLDLTGVNIINLTVTPNGGTGRSLRAFLLKPCNPCACSDGDSSTIRTVLGPGRYYVVIDGPQASDTGPFDLTLDCEPILSQPTGTTMTVGDPTKCNLSLEFDRFADGRGMMANQTWFHSNGDRSFNAIKVNGARVYATNPERSGCLPLSKLVPWVDDNTDKAVIYWRLPEAEVIQTVLGQRVGNPGCCGVRVDTTIRNLDTVPHFYDFRSMYQTDFGPADNFCFFDADGRDESGPVKVDGVDYMTEIDLSCGPSGTCGLACLKPTELKSADDTPQGPPPRPDLSPTKLVFQNLGDSSPDAVKGIVVEYYSDDGICKTEPWLGGLRGSEIGKCSNITFQRRSALAVSWRIPMGQQVVCSAPSDCLQPGEEATFTHMFGDGCRLNPGCGFCLAAADLIVPYSKLCLGHPQTLDASGSSFFGCTGTVNYTWSRDGVSQPPGTNPRYTVNELTPGPHLYEMQVSCEPPPGGNPCTDSRGAVIETFDCATCGISARVSAPGNRACTNQEFTLDSSGSTVNNCPGTLTYEWTRDGVVLPGETAPTLTVLETATGNRAFTVKVTCAAPPEGLNCQGTSAPFNLPVIQGPTVNITPNPATYCNGGNPVVLDAGAGYSSYLWSPGGATTRTISVSPSSSTLYRVTVTDSNGCLGEGAVTVTVTTPAAAEGLVQPPAQCEGTPTTDFTATCTSSPPGGTSLSYAWSITGSPPGWTVVTPNLATTRVVATSPVTVHNVTLHLDVTTTPPGCVTGTDFAIRVIPPGQGSDVGNTLFAKKRPGGLDMSWAAVGAAYSVHKVTARSDILPPPGGTLGIFNTVPIDTPVLPSASISTTEPLVYYQTQAVCP